MIHLGENCTFAVPSVLGEEVEDSVPKKVWSTRTGWPKLIKEPYSTILSLVQYINSGLFHVVLPAGHISEVHPDVARPVYLKTFNSQILEFLPSLGKGLVFHIFLLFSHPELFIWPATGVRRKFFQTVIPIIPCRSVSGDGVLQMFEFQCKNQPFLMQVFLLLVLWSALGNSSRRTLTLLISVQVLGRGEMEQ